jgi:hypothetical protein
MAHSSHPLRNCKRFRCARSPTCVAPTAWASVTVRLLLVALARAPLAQAPPARPARVPPPRRAAFQCSRPTVTTTTRAPRTVVLCQVVASTHRSRAALVARAHPVLAASVASPRVLLVTPTALLPPHALDIPATQPLGCAFPTQWVPSAMTTTCAPLTRVPTLLVAASTLRTSARQPLLASPARARVHKQETRPSPTASSPPRPFRAAQAMLASLTAASRALVVFT